MANAVSAFFRQRRIFPFVALLLATASCNGGSSTAPAAATHLIFASQPTVVRAGSVMRVVIHALDASGALVSSFNGPVSIAFGSNANGAQLLGATTEAAVNGVATFNAFAVDRSGSGFTLVASSASLTEATSTAFDILIAFTTVSAGGHHSCGVSTLGQAYCWGSGVYGQLGAGNIAYDSVPVAVSGGLTFTSVSAGFAHSCGIINTSAAYCWGQNIAGELGDGTQTDRNTPVAVAGGLSFTSISAGDTFTCGVTNTNAVYCWGDNPTGKVGDGTVGTFRKVPTAVLGGLSFSEVSAGDNHACGLTLGNAAYCWGYNATGQLGNGARGQDSVPVAVAGGLAFKAISAGHNFSCASSTTNVLYCWGTNLFGELGNANPTDTASPVPASGALTIPRVSAGFFHACAPDRDGVAYCWGDNSHGELGIGPGGGSVVPVAVHGGLAFASLSAGGNHTCGVISTGAAYCWGENALGQVGDGTFSDRNVPVLVLK